MDPETPGESPRRVTRRDSACVDTWTITGEVDGRTVRLTAGPSGVTGDRLPLARARHIATRRKQVCATPTGPCYPAGLVEPDDVVHLTMLAAFDRVAVVEGDWPPVPVEDIEIPPDAVA